VVDVWDTLISQRPYKEAWPEARAREELLAQAGRALDPGVVAAFLEII
jgi:response regulator RpfG family c-di-GMP phosphodiesterase